MKHNADSEIQTLANAIGAFDPKQTVLIGIRTGGAWVAECVNRQLSVPLALGILDISFYRDDFTRLGLNPSVQASDIGFSVEGKRVILIDDVLYTGRTVRAALNELFDFGRPDRVTLAVMLERNGRELPVQADICGKHLILNESQYIKIYGGDNTPVGYEVNNLP